MAQQTIGLGASPNDGTGDPLRTAFTKANDNFTELYSSVSGLAVVASTGAYSDLTGLPTLGTAAAAATGDFATAAQGAKADTAVQPGSLATVATTGAYADLSGLPSLFDGTYASLTGKPTLFDGAYASLTGKPTLGTASAANTGDFATAVQGGKADTAVQPGALATVATTGAYADLSGKPTIPTVSDAVYGAGWNGNTDAPSKNAVYDKIETISAGAAPEGTAVKSTGETGGSKFLREDGDGTCSWQAIPGGGDALTASPLSQFAATTSAQLAGVISDETGSGALVFGTSPALVTPSLGTPSTLVLTNATGLPATALVPSTTQAVGFGTIELGHASDTTLARVAAGRVSVEGAELAKLASPAFTGNPTAPTQTQGNNSTRIATTAYVDTLGATKAATSHTHTASQISDSTAAGRTLLTAADAAAQRAALAVPGLAVAQNFTAAQGVTPVALTDAATIATDAALGNIFTVTLGGNRTLANPTNLVPGRTYTWVIKQDATGGRTLAYGAAFNWLGASAFAVRSGANQKSMITMLCDEAGSLVGSGVGV